MGWRVVETGKYSSKHLDFQLQDESRLMYSMVTIVNSLLYTRIF